MFDCEIVRKKYKDAVACCESCHSNEKNFFFVVFFNLNLKICCMMKEFLDRKQKK